MVFPVGTNDEAVVCVNVTGFINRVIAGAETPGGISSLVVAVIEVMLVVMLRAGW